MDWNLFIWTSMEPSDLIAIWFSSMARAIDFLIEHWIMPLIINFYKIDSASAAAAAAKEDKDDDEMKMMMIVRREKREMLRSSHNASMLNKKNTTKATPNN